MMKELFLKCCAVFSSTKPAGTSAQLGKLFRVRWWHIISLGKQIYCSGNFFLYAHQLLI
uniref:Uncharacterized protein n=1 Tax=Anguilla anguilla TaxID=7936 RepID=A0A0E9RSL4_ANGAN